MKKYKEEVTMTPRYTTFRVFTRNGEETITFEKAKSPTEAMGLLSNKVTGVMGID